MNGCGRCRTIDGVLTGEMIPHTTPGVVLSDNFMRPAGLAAYALTKAIDVPANRITAITHGDRGVSVDTATRFERHFGTSAEELGSLELRDRCMGWAGICQLSIVG